MTLPPVAATTTGSFPRPGWLAQTSRTAVAFNLEGETLREAQDDATALILREQEEMGFDLLTDGEQRRVSFITHVIAGMDGFDFGKTHLKAIRRRTVANREVPSVTGPIRRRGPIVVDDLRFAKARTKMPVKMAVPGPMTVIDSSFDEHYGDEEAEAMDLAAALNAELLELQGAGADMLQIDEPAMTRYHEKTAAYGARALDRCLEGVTVPTLVHLCYGYPGGEKQQHEYEYPELLDILMTTRISGFSVEFARSGYDPAVLKGCSGRLVMFGCVDPGDTPPEPLQVVVDKVRAALKVVDPGRLLIAPDCGLMTIGRDLAHQKAELLVTAAREVRKSL